MGGTLSNSAEWDFDLPIRLDYTTLTIPDGVTLTLLPGTIIKFDAAVHISTNAGGTLIAEGGESQAEKVVFTAYEDDEFGGDTNGNGTANKPGKGAWWRLNFTNSPDSYLENCIIRYGGYYTSSGNRRGMVLLTYTTYDATSPIVKDCEISHSYDYGIYTDGAAATAPVLSGNDFHDNNNTWAIILQSTVQSPLVTGNTITGQTHGIHVRGASATVTGNTLVDTPTHGIYVYDGTGHTITDNVTSGDISYSLYLTNYAGRLGALGNNVFSGTGINPVRVGIDDVPLLHNNTFSYPDARGYLVKGGTLTEDAIWRPLDQPFVLESYTITIPAEHTLTFDAGVILKMNRYAINTYGRLETNGTEGEPVVITSLADDEYGGDTNNNGNLTSPAKSNWYYVQFFAGAEGDLQGTKLRYSGYGGGYGIVATGTTLNLADCSIEHVPTYGIYAQSTTSLDAVRTSIHDVGRGVQCRTSTTATLTNCNFTETPTYAVENIDAAVTIEAANCWWGNDTGPYHADTNPGGSGNKVSNYVNFSPWMNYPYSPEPVVVQLTAYQWVVPRGGTYDFKETMVNTSDNDETFEHRFVVYDDDGEVFHTFPPRPYSLSGGEVAVSLYTLGVPSNLPTGSYMLEAVAYNGGDEYDADSLYVDVIDLIDDDPGAGEENLLMAGMSSANAMLSDADGRQNGGSEMLSNASFASLSSRGSSQGQKASTAMLGTTAGASYTDVLDAPVTTTRARWTLRLREATRFLRDGQEKAGGSPYQVGEEMASEPVTAEAMKQVREVEDAIAEAEEALEDELARLDETPGMDPVFKFELSSAFPNPFNPTVNLPFELAEDMRAQLKIYDLSGRRVATLIDGHLPAGRHTVTWHGTSDAGGVLPSGAYMVRLVAGKELAQRRLLLVK